MARVLGSYPIGRWFKSYCRYQIRPVGQEVKTPPFHGGIMGSIPVRVTNYVTRKWRNTAVCEFFLFREINLATYLPLVLKICRLHCHLHISLWLFFVSEGKRVDDSVAISRFRFLEHMTVDVTCCTYAGMSHIT